MPHQFDMSGAYLPSNAVKRVHIATIDIDEEVEDEYLVLLVSRICGAILGSGFHEDAIRLGYRVVDEVILIYKEVYLLDLHQHLEPN